MPALTRRLGRVRLFATEAAEAPLKWSIARLEAVLDKITDPEKFNRSGGGSGRRLECPEAALAACRNGTALRFTEQQHAWRN
jgi:hypothetical protein